jgi:tripartite-type tricarboxylate transporter receptor subunit TctC
MTSNNHTINPFIYKDPGYSTLQDLLPVVQVARGPTVIAVHPQTPMNSMKELITFSQTKPVSYGSIGVGSAAHLVGECLKPLTGAKFEHVPYKGGAPAVFDAVAGHIPLVMSSLASLGPYIKTGKLRALAVSSAERWPGYAEIPTLNGMPTILLQLPPRIQSMMINRPHRKYSSCTCKETQNPKPLTLNPKL